jgi:FLVCR family feline leukemia virus subgroup C receptor-related protein
MVASSPQRSFALERVVELWMVHGRQTEDLEPNRPMPQHQGHSEQQSHERQHHTEYTLYRKRWVVLASFSLLTLTSAWIWITWSPLSSMMAVYWGVSESSVDALAGIYLYVYLPCSFVSLWLVNRYGMRYGLLCGATLNLLGALVRWRFVDMYSLVYSGTFLCAVAQTFTLATPPLLAGHWFGAHERASATAFGVLMNLAGVAVGLGATIVVDFQGRATETDETDSTFLETADETTTLTPGTTNTLYINESTLFTYVGMQLGCSILAWLLVAAFVTSDRPPTPPSSAAAAMAMPCLNGKQTSDVTPDETTALMQAENGTATGNDASNTQFFRTVDYWQSVKATLFGSAGPFVPVFGLAVGVYYTIPTFLSQLTPISWSARADGWLGLLYILSGLAGSMAMGCLLDRHPNQHWRICLGLLVGAFLSWIVVTYCTFQETEDEKLLQTVGIFTGTILTGFCLAAMISVGMEYATAMTYPADAAAVAGILECAAEGMGYVLVTIGGNIMPEVAQFHGVLLGAQWIALLWLVMAVRGESKRPSS